MIVITGGEVRARQAVAEAAGEAGHEAGTAPEGTVSALAPGDVLVDLGLPPSAWPPGAALVEVEAERARALAGVATDARRIVRVSVIGAAPDARSHLQRAQHGAEDVWRGSGARAVVLRAGILLGDCGLAAGFRRLVERSKVIPLPGVWHAKLEPLLLEDLALYCLEAATADGPFDEAYDLGCGEILTGGLLARGIADNLGIGRWVWALPGLLRGPMAALFAAPGLPPVAARHWMDALAAGLLPRGVGAWKAFRVQPVDLRQAMAFGVGMKYPLRAAKGRFGAWRAPDRKGVLGQGLRRRR